MTSTDNDDEVSYGDMFEYIQGYSHDMPESLQRFIDSVHKQYLERGTLSPKQGAAIEKIYNNTKNRRG